VTFWSQTRRATRLRYAPPDTGVRYTLRCDAASKLRRGQVSASFENWGGNAVAWSNAEFLRRSADDFQDGPHRPPGRNKLG
jgi:hypothetical protein